MFSYFKEIKIPKILFILIGLYFGGFQYDNKLYNSLPNVILFGSELWEIKSLYNTFGAALLVIAVINGFGSKFILSNFIQRLGKISFSIYLIHFILLCSVSSWIYISIEQSVLILVMNFALYLTACIFFAGLFDKNSILIARKFGTFLFRNEV
jgi:peptidoglycan/LPS O-acetylase OafA/YrhL